ncbi:MAG: hypothetical protein IJE60_08420 [Tyzzerella sp.]|nr:hypothetical protein [Tyzzerella sp.]
MTMETVANTGGRIFYVSEKGNDEKDGLTPESAWKTIKRVNADAGEVAYGDTVLFERGGIYRGSTKLISGVTYGSYGQGEKPCLYGSLRNYAEESLWEATSTEHIWKLNVGTMKDIGNLVFDHGKAWAMKRLEMTLSEDFDFWHDQEGQELYLYSSTGNPGLVYEDIEVCSNDHIMYGPTQYMKDILIENLCLKYTGAHGICFSHGSKNITVRNCEIGYIGGSMLDETVRYGNGFEVVDGCCDILVENNWVYQCYDAGITHQSSFQPGCVQENIVFRGNLIEYCNYNIEYYVSEENGIIEDTVYENNILRYAGFGFGSENRIGSDTSVLSHICCYSRMMPSKNFIIRNNVLDTSLRFLTAIGCTNDKEGLGPTMVGNHYIQSSNQEGNVELIKLWEQERKERVAISIRSQEEMESVVSRIDMKPGVVVLKKTND